MKLARRKFLYLAAGAVALPAGSRVASAQAYPTRPITMTVPGDAGGPADTVGRVLAERMRASLGQPIIIENVTGAEGNIATTRATRAKPDGYTIDLGLQANHVLNGALYSLQYDLLDDFTPISLLVSVPEVLYARNTLPAKDLKELITWLKVNSNAVSAGTDSAAVRLITVLFQRKTGSRFALVPYPGGAPAIQDLAAGQIDLLFAPPDGLSLVRAGTIKAYAVTSEKRLGIAPEIPTLAEMGLPALSFYAWLGLFAPKGTPKEVIGKLKATTVQALADPAVRSRLADLGWEVFPRDRQTPEALGAAVKADAEKWWPIIRWWHRLSSCRKVFAC
jgi:tripartite-type tricarboxylate transporter receptor subunit TctC